MTTLREFLSLPIDARGPQNDRQVGVDELGRPVYAGQIGSQYTMTEQPRTSAGETLAELAGAFREAPVDTTGNVVRALLEGAWNGVEAPGNALRGIPQTYGDVADTALDWGVMSATGSAPRGAIRSGFSGDDYRGIHRAPGLDAFNEGAAARLDDLTAVYPDDVYDARVAAQYYGHGGNHAAMDRESLQAIAAARGNPDAMVTVYRAVPDSVQGGLNPGDWVTASRRYAEEHGQGLIGDPRFGESGGYRIIEQQVPARELFTDGNSINEFGWSPDTSTQGRGAIEAGGGASIANPPPVRNSSGSPGVDNSGISVGNLADGPESPAQRIARFLSEGREYRVTDDMLGALTPNDNMELARLYDEGATGMPMPMDEASRMARAREMGFDTTVFHGTDAIDRWNVPDRLSPDMGRGARHGTGIWTSADNTVANSYAPYRTGANMPLVRRSADDLVYDAGGDNWARLSGPHDAYYPARDGYVETVDVFDDASTNDIARNVRLGSQTTAEDVRLLRDLGVDDVSEGFNGPQGVEFADVRDVGPFRHEMRGQPPAAEVATNYVDFNPTNIRSRFARFDPRLRHLANLSAGIGAGAVMLPQEREDTRPLREYLGL
jgi:hypothetical protein